MRIVCVKKINYLLTDETSSFPKKIPITLSTFQAFEKLTPNESAANIYFLFESKAFKDFKNFSFGTD